MDAGLSAESPWVVTAGEQSPQTVRRLLDLLPDWFGIEASNQHYIEVAATLPTYLAWPAHAGGEAVGVLLVKRHFPGTAEIYFLAVDPAHHRRGAGRALLHALERDLAADRAGAGRHGLLQVKTLGPSHPDPGYARTRLFYEGVGFSPLEELADLWPDNPCLIMVKVLPWAS